MSKFVSELGYEGKCWLLYCYFDIWRTMREWHFIQSMMAHPSKRTSGRDRLNAIISEAMRLNWLILNMSFIVSCFSFGITTGLPPSPGPSRGFTRASAAKNTHRSECARQRLCDQCGTCTHRISLAVLSLSCCHTCCTRWSRAVWTYPASPTPERWPKPPYSKRTAASCKWEEMKTDRGRRWKKNVTALTEVRTDAEPSTGEIHRLPKALEGERSISSHISLPYSLLPSSSSTPTALRLSIFSTLPSVFPLVCLTPGSYLPAGYHRFSRWSPPHWEKPGELVSNYWRTGYVFEHTVISGKLYLHYNFFKRLCL